MNSNLHQAQSHEILRSWQSQRFDINHHKDFVLPMFIGNEDDSIEPIESMPSVYRYGCNRAIEYLEPLIHSFGLRSVLLFPVVTKLDKVRLDAKLESRQQRAGTRSSSNSEFENEEEEEEEEEEVVEKRRGAAGRGAEGASPNSSYSRFSPRYSVSSNSSSNSLSSSSSISRSHAGAKGEKLVGEQESLSNNNNNNNNSNAQNPFLNQNDEEDHLLAGELDQVSAGQPPKSSQARLDPSGETLLRKVSKTQDVRLIRGLALKDKYNPVLRLIPKLRSKFPRLLIICDVCLCAFTSTGHCCLFEDHSRASGSTSNSARSSLLQKFPISNKSTCQYLAMLSLEYALRGCDVVAPSDMMDGRILTIREKLNQQGLSHVSILSYSAKFASAFYGPFRQATNNAPEFGDRRAYQLPPGSRALALKAVRRDISQGADFVMVKPAGPYLDIVRDISEQHPDVPVAVYQVSGEYSMLKVAASAGVLDLKLAVGEMLTAYRRAGANIIISYFTPELLRGELMIGGD